MTMRRAALAIAVTLCGAHTSSAKDRELLDLRPAGRLGRRLEAKESVDDRYQYVARGSGGIRRARFVCEYQDEVFELKPYGASRRYERSRKGDIKGGGEPELKKTASEDKAVKITRHGVLFLPGLTKTPGRDSAPILDADHVFLGRLAAAILPSEPKAEGDRWRLSTAEVRRVLNADKKASELKGSFQVCLRSVKRRKGQRIARLSLKLDLAGKQKDTDSRIRGKGSADFDLDRGVITELKLRYDYRLKVGEIEVEGERQAQLKVSVTEDGSGDQVRDPAPKPAGQKAP